MGILSKTKCTVIGPMQYANGRPIREYLTAELGKRGITVFDHYHKPFVDSAEEDESVHANLKIWLENEEYDKIAERKAVRTFDLKLIDMSDFIIFMFDPAVITCGSWEEFFWANRMKKSIFFVNLAGKKKTPFWVFWTIPHKYIYSSVEEVLQRIDDIDTGKHPLDNDRWKLLKMEYR
jgi:hypothetical protein